ncbi:hypothetical protein BJX64DRAFT_285316 [Aspergillus heterothallicus]
MDFYILRTYNRINESGALQHATEVSHVDYNSTSLEHDDTVDPFGLRTQKKIGEFEETKITADYEAYRNQKASTAHSAWDTVSSCYMLGGEDIRKVTWPAGGSVPDIDAFASEEFNGYSKVLIAGDWVIICDSANLNDRSAI